MFKSGGTMERKKTISIKRDSSIEMAEEYMFKEIRSIQAEDSVVLDMAMVHSAKAEMVPLLIIVSYLAYTKTHKFVRLSNVSPELMEYLNWIGFWKLSHIGHTGRITGMNKKRQENTKVILPIIHIHDYAQLNDVILKIRGTQSRTLADDLKRIMERILLILGENCFDHSALDMKAGFFIYAEECDNTVIMLVLDMGQGFYKSISKKYSDIATDGEAIVRVLMEHISSRDEEGGYGYSHISELINKYSGRIMIRSGDAIVHFGAGEIKKSEETMEKITGCCVMVGLDK